MALRDVLIGKWETLLFNCELVNTRLIVTGALVAPRGDAIHMFASMIGALMLVRAVNDNEFAQEILVETRKRIVGVSNISE